MNTCIIIPARFQSSRFPGKPLANILDKPMIIWVAELCSHAIGIENTFIATDHPLIVDVVSSFGYNVVLTSSSCLTGTDRVAEAAMSLAYDYFINVQGDEPLLNPSDIKTFINLLPTVDSSTVLNGYSFLSSHDDVSSPNIPKIVTDLDDKLLYISRAVIPSSKSPEHLCDHIYKKQVCIYGYSKALLSSFYHYGQKSPLESLEDIEILRFQELGYNIKMLQCSESTYAVDIPSDITIVEQQLISQSS